MCAEGRHNEISEQQCWMKIALRVSRIMCSSAIACARGRAGLTFKGSTEEQIVSATHVDSMLVRSSLVGEQKSTVMVHSTTKLLCGQTASLLRTHVPSRSRLSESRRCIELSTTGLCQLRCQPLEHNYRLRPWSSTKFEGDRLRVQTCTHRCCTLFASVPSAHCAYPDRVNVFSTSVTRVLFWTRCWPFAH